MHACNSKENTGYVFKVSSIMCYDTDTSAHTAQTSHRLRLNQFDRNWFVEVGVLQHLYFCCSTKRLSN